MSDHNVMQDLDLVVRHFVYQHFALETRPPSVVETAKELDLAEEFAKTVYKILHENHFFFLEPGAQSR